MVALLPLLLFLDLAAAPAHDDVPVYVQALSDLHARSDRQYDPHTRAQFCHGASLAELRRDTLASFNRRNEKESPLPNGIFLSYVATNHMPVQVRLSAVGWSQDGHQAFVEVSLLDDFTNLHFQPYCLLYRVGPDGLRLVKKL